MLRRDVIPLLLLSFSACSRGPEPATAVLDAAHVAGAVLTLPDDQAGQLLARAIAAAGGWPTWARHRDASFISTFTIFDLRGNATSETIFLHKLLLHAGAKSRLESIGLEEELLFGLDGLDWWMLRSGRPLTDERSTAFTRFDAVSAEYWFQVPFVLAEIPGKLTYAGSDSDGAKRWQKLRVDYDSAAAVPANWVVAYVDVETGLVDRVFCEIRTEFLRQKLWRGEFDDYRSIDGIRRERRREFFPVDDTDKLLGTKAAQQIVEHIRFDNDFPPDLFVRPPLVEGAQTAT